MIVFRLSKSKYADDLTGKGAEQAGGRWNSKGTPMIYTAANRALCTAELAVHLPLGIIPLDYVLTEIEIPDNAIREFPIKELPDNWRSFPHPNSTQIMGDRFIAEKKYLTLQVPSAVVQGEFNFLINPRHPDVSQLRFMHAEPFEFDSRLFDR